MTTDTPIFFPTPTAESLFGIAREIVDFANEYTEHLSFEDYSMLMELEAKLLAFANLLSVHDRESFLAEELADAIETLQWLRQRLPGESDSDADSS